MLAIRMRRVGAKKSPFFRVVVSEHRELPSGSPLEHLVQRRASKDRFLRLLESGGAGSGTDGASGTGTGAGGGGGVTADPVGHLEIRDGLATFTPIVPPFPSPWFILASGVTAALVIRALARLLRG